MKILRPPQLPFLFGLSFLRFAAPLSPQGLSWNDLRSLTLPVSPPAPVFDPALDDVPSPPAPGSVPTLLRERNGWCPYSERAWLALELSGVRFDTLLIDNMGGPRPAWYRGSTPQFAAEDGERRGESMDIVRRVSDAYCSDRDGGLYSEEVPSLVQRTVSRFRDVFPRNTRPSSRSAFLFSNMGMPVSRKEFERTLLAVDDLIAANRGSVEGEGLESGLFLAGTTGPTAADVAFVPFLERYAAQLPLLHEGLNPRCESSYPHLSAWYGAMDRVPAYICRVKGCDVSWGRVLGQVGYGNAGAPPHIASGGEEEDPVDARAWTAEKIVSGAAVRCWDAYTGGGGVAPSPQVEAARRIVSNRRGLARDMAKFANMEEDSSDESLRMAAGAIASMGIRAEGAKEYLEKIEGGWELAGKAALYLHKRICVPRDMGVLPASYIRSLYVLTNSK